MGLIKSDNGPRITAPLRETRPEEIGEPAPV
jgi:hypothetical protein